MSVRVMAAWLLITGTAYAAPPRAVISGPSSALAGEIVVLDGSASEGVAHHLWIVAPTNSRRMFVPAGEGRRIYCATFPGVWSYTLIVSNADGISAETVTLTVDGSQPLPPPLPPLPGPQPPVPPSPTPPAPVPPVDPTPPDGPFTVARDVYRAALQVASPNRKAEAMAMADVFRGARESQITGVNSIALAQAVATYLNAAKAKALGATEALWDPVVSAIGAKVSAAVASGRLAKTADYDALFLEIETALRAAAQ